MRPPRPRRLRRRRRCRIDGCAENRHRRVVKKKTSWPVFGVDWPFNTIKEDATMRKFLLALTVVALVSAVGYPTRCLAEGVEADAVFEQLKSLAGTWTGTTKGAGEAAEGEAAEGEAAEGEAAEGEAAMMHDVVHKIEVSAAGTVVMETMAPGTPHEMINMYHLDGDELVLTQPCQEHGGHAGLRFHRWHQSGSGGGSAHPRGRDQDGRQRAYGERLDRLFGGQAGRLDDLRAGQAGVGPIRPWRGHHAAGKRRPPVPWPPMARPRSRNSAR